MLRVPVQELNQLASEGETVYDISALRRLRQNGYPASIKPGVSKSNLALSAFHAVAKQTIGGLAQGLTIRGTVVFEGGPMTFEPRLIQVFAERFIFQMKKS